MYYEKVFKSPINTSVSKNLYSFPKTQRFQKTKSSPCSRSFYQINSLKNTPRTTCFGFGNRSNLANQQPIPEPGYYKHNSSSFYQNKNKKRGFSFGGQIKTCFPYQNIDKDNPGPGKYDSLMKYNNSYSIRSKYQDPLQKDKNMLGPGQYRVTQNLSKTGVYYNSRFKSSQCGRIGRQRRFLDDSTPVPGPGTYKNKFQINRSGIYFDSRIRSNFVPSFQGTSRPPINQRSQAPGPGTYYVFSQFSSRFVHN